MIPLHISWERGGVERKRERVKEGERDSNSKEDASGSYFSLSSLVARINKIQKISRYVLEESDVSIPPCF